MSQIVSMEKLKLTDELSELCRQSDEPIFITNNGLDEMVVMSMNTFERTMFINNVYRKLEEAESSITNGNVIDGFESLRIIRQKYGL